MSNNTVGERLRAAREMAGLTQKAVADQLEIPRQVISYFENDIRNPNIKTLTILANIYGTSTDFLLDCTDVSTQNADLRAICDYTGLSEEAVTLLHIAKMLEENPLPESSTDYVGYHSHLSNFITITYPQISKLLAQLNAKAETARKALIDETEGMKVGVQIQLPLEQSDESSYYEKYNFKNTNAETLFFEVRHIRHDILDEFDEYIEDTCCEYKDMVLAKREHSRQKFENELEAEIKSEDNNGNDN